MRPDFIQWATSRGGMYLHDKLKPTLATWQTYQADILRHVFPAGEGRLPYSRVIWSDVKKSGKTELAAAVQLYFGLFVDVPGEQYVLANDFEGARGRVWRYIEGSLARNVLMTDDDWRVVGNEIRFKNGTTIKAIASDYKGEAGANLSIATVDEPWGIMSESATRLMTEFSPVPTRENSTVFYTGYQGWDGQSEYWHTLIDSGRAEPVPELLHIEDGDGVPACWRAGRTFVLWNHKARMAWHTEEFLAEQKRSLPPSEYLRVWENRRVKNADGFCSEEQWQRLHDAGLRGLHKGDQRVIVLGVDAATKSDCSAVVACAWNDTTKKVEEVFTKIWQPDGREPLKLTETVGPEIIRLHQAYRVAGVYYDPYQMAAIAEMCVRAKVAMIEFPQTSRRVQADTHLHGLIWGGNLAHHGDPGLGAHILNALTKETERGRRIIKEISSAKVDAAVALSMAALGAVEMLAGGESAVLVTARNPFYE